ncbi:uncharacterized protein LOC115980957 [Quercus lobata]|uniref:uncharacterized protein LOC115980957 n=1 Tax=Quercus lobata TaxID=97700 RepID=UPI001248E21F|nr:uncharacterized protein LOC115980957 [Quercus lobata]
MGDDEAFDSFYGKLNEIVIAELNLGEKIEDSKVVRKILRSLPESFRAKVTAIEESKDLDEIKIQELIGSLQTYELGLPFHKSSKSLALKTITKRMDNPSEEDDVEKEVVFLAKNFRKFLKMNNSGKPFNSGKFSSPKGDRKEFRKKDGKDSQSTQGITCFECNGHEESDAEIDEDIASLQENYNSLLEKLGEYAKVAKATVKKMKKAEEDYRSLLVRYKEAKCEIETLNGELTEAYTKVKFLELEVVQANSKVKRVSTKKLDDILSSQKTFSDKTVLGYTGGSSSAMNISKELKFVKAKEPIAVVPTVEKANVE